MFPPHLPPKSCNIARHQKWRRLKIIFALTIFALIVGMSGASMMIGWIWPRFAEGDTWIASYVHPALSRVQMEDRVRQEISLRIVSVYQSESALNGVNYLKQKMGDAIVVSSDGWVAMYKPDYDGSYKNFSVLAKDGQVYQLENAVMDKYSGVLYLKIKNAQFDVVNFSGSISAGEDIFVFNDSDWYHSVVDYPVMSANVIPHMDTAPVLFYSLDGKFKLGDVVINSQGTVDGLIQNDGSLLSSDYITRVLPNILSAQTVVYPSLGADGWFSEEQPIVVASSSASGFAVTRVWSAGSKLRKGDIITEINGRVVTADDLWYNITGNTTVRLQIIRAGKTIEIETKLTDTQKQ